MGACWADISFSDSNTSGPRCSKVVLCHPCSMLGINLSVQTLCVFLLLGCFSFPEVLDCITVAPYLKMIS